jgi:hypothetical protein
MLFSSDCDRHLRMISLHRLPTVKVAFENSIVTPVFAIKHLRTALRAPKTVQHVDSERRDSNRDT